MRQILSKDVSFLKIVSKILIIGFLVSCFIALYNGLVLDLEWPLNSFLFKPSSRFSDFIDTMLQTRNSWTGHNSGNYLPFIYMLLFPFIFLGDKIGLILSIVIFVVAFGTTTFLFLKDLFKRKQIIFLLFSLFLSYPFLIVIDRGNLESFLYIFVVLFLYFFLKNKLWLASLFLSLAIAFKGFPAVLLILFLKDKKFDWFLKVVIISTLLTLFSMCFFRISFVSLIGNFTAYNGVVDYGWSVAFGNNLYGALRTILSVLKIDIQSQIVCFNFLRYFNFLFFGLVFIYLIFCKEKFWKSVYLLLVSTCLFMTASGDYKLLYICIVLFLYLREKNRGKLDLIYGILLGLFLIPMNWIFLETDLPYRYIQISVVLRPILMFFMMILILVEGIVKKKVMILNGIRIFSIKIIMIFQKHILFIIVGIVFVLFLIVGGNLLVSNDVGNPVKWNKKNRQFFNERILKGQTIYQEFVAENNNMGTIAIQFTNFGKINDGFILFRLFNNEGGLIYENFYKIDQFNPDFPFTFGFPVLENSKGKKYIFEIVSVDGDGNNSVGLSDVDFFMIKYDFSLKRLKNNPIYLLELIKIKSLICP